jgi:hypothetical protein
MLLAQHTAVAVLLLLAQQTPTADAEECPLHSLVARTQTAMSACCVGWPAPGSSGQRRRLQTSKCQLPSVCTQTCAQVFGPCELAPCTFLP